MVVIIVQQMVVNWQLSVWYLSKTGICSSLPFGGQNFSIMEYQTELAFLTLTNIRHFWMASNSR